MAAIDEPDFTSQEEVLQIIADSWKEVMKPPAERMGAMKSHATSSSLGKETESEKPPMSDAKATPPKKSGFFSRFTSRSTNKGEAASAGYASSAGTESQSMKYDVPQTFDEMVKVNAGITGANPTYINIMLDGFGDIVRDVCKYGQLQEQTDILAMRICKDVRGDYTTSQFKVCLLASMRSLIPGRWDTRHERAWMWLWDSVDAQLGASLVYPRKYEKLVVEWVGGLQRQERREIGMAVWKRLFAVDPQAESVFKQSNERLIFIVEKALEFCMRIYGSPTQVDQEIRSLGLRHIMFGAKPNNFALFVKMMEEELKSRGIEETTVAGVQWSLATIACIMARTVEEGSTPILLAALSNNAKEVRKVLAQQPRGTRAKSMLSVQGE